MGKSNVWCCVYGCNSSYKKKNISFHNFPKRENEPKVHITNKFGEQERVGRFLAWTSALKVVPNEVTRSMRVCSLHFTEDDFKLPSRDRGEPRITKRLKWDAVPSQNLPVSSQQDIERKSSDIAEKKAARRTKRNLLVSIPVETIIKEEDPLTLEESDTSLDIKLEEPEPSTSTDDMEECQNNTCDKSVQVSSEDITMCRFVSIIDTPKKLNIFTGLPDFDILQWLAEEVKMVVKDQRSHKLSIRERVILTLMKLKHNLSFSLLSVLFGNVTSTTCKKIFKDTIIILSNVLKSVEPWPWKNEILERIPRSLVKIRLIECTDQIQETDETEGELPEDDMFLL